MTVHLVFSLHDFVVAGGTVVFSVALALWLHDRR
jgi:small neutral amino acid transporter SnatA (MarC family)